MDLHDLAKKKLDLSRSKAWINQDLEKIVRFKDKTGDSSTEKNKFNCFCCLKSLNKIGIKQPITCEISRTNFQQVMFLPNLIGKCLGLLPVLTIYDGSKISGYKFSVTSLRFWYSAWMCAAQGLAAVLCLLRLFRSTISFSLLSFVLFYGPVSYTTYLFIRIATKWPELMKEVANTEQLDPIYDRRLKFKCTTAALIVILLATLEHVLSIMAKFAMLINCHDSSKPITDLFFEINFPWVYEITDIRSLYLGIFLQVMNIQATLNWNYSDLYIICVSFYLTSRLQQISNNLLQTKGKNLPTSYWRKMREDYNRIACLVHSFDRTINPVVFVSFASNLFFICLQLFNTLSKGIEDGGLSFEFCEIDDDSESTFTPIFGYENTVYYIFSLLFLLFRSLAMSLIAARVHTVAREPAEALYCVPSAAYCTEVERFIDQVHGDTVALSGLRFFHVTRGVVLKVAGTIVTYELVLLQFSHAV